MMFAHERFESRADGDDQEDVEDDEVPPPPGARGTRRRPTQMRGRPVIQGSFDPRLRMFSRVETDYPQRVTLVPARTQCLCCGGSAGSRSVITPVALGTSAAVKVLGEGLVGALTEANRDRPGHDGKERLLVFSDSRQDAAHQARFVTFAGRYDRMRRRVVGLLQSQGSLSLQRTVELLGDEAAQRRDNPHVPEEPNAWIADETRQRIRSWEEAPLLDEIAVNAGYRATLINVGMMRVTYHRLNEYLSERGPSLGSRLGVELPRLEHICRCLLDEMRTRGCLSRELLRYHPQHPSCPDIVAAAEWERRFKQPQGYAASSSGNPLPSMDAAEVPQGIKRQNAWRRPGAGGRGPSLERILKHLLARWCGGIDPRPDDMVELLDFLRRGSFLVATELFGARDRCRLLQVNAEALRLELVSSADRLRCEICSVVLAGAGGEAPCPRCHGRLIPWPEAEVLQNRTVRRVLAGEVVPLVAGEHTAQIPNDVRLSWEEKFKAPPEVSSVNLLACSPTLEMGIDVGGLDAIILRNVPPRPDNYAQRGGRAGRRTRVGLVVGYARSTPHDQYFYERPSEMIAGEVPAPLLALGNRDVMLRHLNAIAFGAADPGLAGKMVEYVSPMGEVKQDAVNALIAGVSAQTDHTLTLAREAWGTDLLAAAQLQEADLRAWLESLPSKIQDVVDRTARQVRELRAALDTYAAELRNRRAGARAGDLVARLLGIETEPRPGRTEADDRSAGYPLRRFAEFGILPGYEFPTEPAALRLLGDPNEEDPVTVARRFGIDQFRPDAQVYARTRRWKVVGLDNASPWNPQVEEAVWNYRLCSTCKLHFDAASPRCPRCATDTPGRALPAAEFGGFLARRDENPILDEEERFATRSLSRMYPQWDGQVVGRWAAGPGWGIRLSSNEEVRWLNEGLTPTPTELEENTLRLHNGAKGFLLCGSCGRTLKVPPSTTAGGGRRRARAGNNQQDIYGHSAGCPRAGTPPQPLALVTSSSAQVLRLIVPVPQCSSDADRRSLQSWGLTLGYSLRVGMRRLYMLDGPEIEFDVEGPWRTQDGAPSFWQMSLAFIDPSLGGSGYLPRIARELHWVAQRALEHLDHPGCETACYRCLKSYQNQRFHELLEWPRVVADLEALATQAPVVRPLETGDLDDPRPWLEAYAAGVGSPLELRFLRLFEQHGFHPSKQVRVAETEGGPAISIADFAVPERRVAIYIDGAAFHVGSNLRRDRYIRNRLRNGNPPWRVVELRAADLARGRALIEELFSQA